MTSGGTFPGDGLFPGPGTFPGESSFPGTSSAWYYRGPHYTVRFRLDKDSRRFWGTYEQGQTVYRKDGVWHTVFTPTAEELAGADAVYGGGRVYRLTNQEHIALSAAGFDDYMTFEENPL